MPKTLFWTASIGLLVSFIPLVGAADDDLAGCRIENFGQVVDCTGGGGDQKREDGFWTGPVAQTSYAILGLAATGAAGLFTTRRVRRKRRELRVFLSDVEQAHAEAKANPEAGLAKLENLRQGLTASHNQGRLDDSQFLEMDRRLRDYITRARLVQLEQAFPNLPVALFSEVRTVLGDGQLSPADLALVEKRAQQADVPLVERRQLLSHLGKWANGAATPAPARRRLAVLAR
jgi:hypothetical protein